MSPTDPALKARLLAEAEAAITTLLANRKPAAEADLRDIEQVVLKASQHFTQALTAALVAESGQVVEAERPQCPKCGERMRAKGHQARQLVTEVGEVTLERAYYHCAACKTGLFPPG
jgi:uncharacterized protein with PIN domain